MNKVKTTNDLELKDRLVAVNRVTKVTKGGRTFSFSAIVVVGNEDGIVGWGLGKAGEVTAAIAKGTEAAKKNLIKVPVLNGTIPHEQLAKFGGAQVYILKSTCGKVLLSSSDASRCRSDRSFCSICFIVSISSFNVASLSLAYITGLLGTAFSSSFNA